MATGMPSPTAKLTYDDFVLLPADGHRHELLDGEHHVTPAPGLRHQRLLRRLLVALDAAAQADGAGEVLCAPFDVVVSRHDVLEPDLLFVSAERSAVLTAANAQGAPDLVVEILSPASRRLDEILKRDLYERAGVAEYWIVDPEAEAVKVLRRSEGGLFGRAHLLTRRDGDVLTTPLLPGLLLALEAVFAR
jgi:Uma2 family endonuclease